MFRVNSVTLAIGGDRGGDFFGFFGAKKRRDTPKNSPRLFRAETHLELDANFAHNEGKGQLLAARPNPDGCNLGHSQLPCLTE
jgi:hypothetical protein